MSANDVTVQDLEQRAAEAESRLAVLESKVGKDHISPWLASTNARQSHRRCRWRPAAGGTGSINAAAYVSQLEALREIMVAAKAEQEQLENRVAELTTDNSKLAYQVMFLKRAVKEADAKLAA